MTALPPDAFAPAEGAMGHHVMAAMSHFGASRLSDREAAVARLILQGHSSKVIARMLGNSPETVKVYRKRIHTKLGLASSAELFSLFLAALCAAPEGTADDPLIHLS
ncbi:MAG: helix-turn-helix transcriptional regulator [Proteobacteria bacterium]|nr:helix-turn-helix transcriptional regulator [Pseudomonadota bacterium]